MSCGQEIAMRPCICWPFLFQDADETLPLIGWCRRLRSTANTIMPRWSASPRAEAVAVEDLVVAAATAEVAVEVQETTSLLLATAMAKMEVVMAVEAARVAGEAAVANRDARWWGAGR